jgi:hypothetical protein
MEVPVFVDWQLTYDWEDDGFHLLCLTAGDANTDTSLRIRALRMVCWLLLEGGLREPYEDEWGPMLKRAACGDNEQIRMLARETLASVEREEPAGSRADSLLCPGRVSEWGDLQGILLFAESDWKCRIYRPDVVDVMSLD